MTTGRKCIILMDGWERSGRKGLRFYLYPASRGHERESKKDEPRDVKGNRHGRDLESVFFLGIHF